MSFCYSARTCEGVQLAFEELVEKVHVLVHLEDHNIYKHIIQCKQNLQHIYLPDSVWLWTKFMLTSVDIKISFYVSNYSFILVCSYLWSIGGQMRSWHANKPKLLRDSYSAPLLLHAAFISEINITDFRFDVFSAGNPDTWSMGEKRQHRRSDANSRVTGHLWLQWNVFSDMTTVNCNLLCDTVNMELTTWTCTCMNLHHTWFKCASSVWETNMKGMGFWAKRESGLRTQ